MKTKTTTRAAVKAAATAKWLVFTDADVNKALAKAERWMRNAYGEVDWNEEDGQEGNTLSYLEETLANPSGRSTFSRDARAFRSKS
jgi:hypothetical protein